MTGTEYYHEIKKHAGRDFPFNIYPCTIPLDFRQVPVHWHEEMELIAVKKGRGTVTADLIPYEVKAGETVVVFPGQLHGIGQLGGEAMEYENIIFQPTMLMASADEACTSRFLLPLVMEGGQAPVHITQESPGYREFMRCIEVMDRMCGERPYGYQLAVKGALFGFLFQVFTHYREAVPEGSRKYREKIKTLLRHIEDHYGERLTVEEAAGMCFYSKSHFMKFFRQHMGCSFVDYLNDYRLAMAAGFLASTGDTVTEIAQRCGFDNISYFNRMFKRKYGQAPAAYRKTGVFRG